MARSEGIKESYLSTDCHRLGTALLWPNHMALSSGVMTALHLAFYILCMLVYLNTQRFVPSKILGSSQVKIASLPRLRDCSFPGMQDFSFEDLYCVFIPRKLIIQINELDRISITLRPGKPPRIPWSPWKISSRNKFEQLIVVRPVQSSPLLLPSARLVRHDTLPAFLQGAAPFDPIKIMKASRPSPQYLKQFFEKEHLSCAPIRYSKPRGFVIARYHNRWQLMKMPPPNQLLVSYWSKNAIVVQG